MKVFITGDTHGNPVSFYRLRDYAVRNDLSLEDIIIICGDAGLYYGGLAVDSVKDIMMQTPCNFLVVRGNHDDRIEDVVRKFAVSGSWGKQELLGNSVYVDRKYPNIFYALDEGGLYEIYGEKVLFAPGAYSIDKFYRLARGLPYNPNEQLSAEEMDNLLQLAEQHPDIVGVIAHTAPLSWEPCFRDLFFPGLDQSKIDKTTDTFLDSLVERLPNLAYYYFGHFHDDRNCGEHGIMLYHELVEYGQRLETQ